MSSINLTAVPRRLATEYGRPVPYKKLWGAIVDGQIPAQQGENGRWYVAESDLPTVAAHFGLTKAAAA